MTIIISHGFLIDELPNLPVFRVLYKDMEYGFQSTTNGHDILNNIVNNAFSIEELFSERLHPSNVGTVLSRISNEKYGILAHNKSEALGSMIEMLPSYLSAIKKSSLLQKLGRKPNTPPPPSIDFEKVFIQSSLEEKTEALLNICEFITIWPKYWGGYGEHFFVATKFPEKIKEFLKNPIECDFFFENSETPQAL